jgi:hypothetical protein
VDQNDFGRRVVPVRPGKAYRAQYWQVTGSFRDLPGGELRASIWMENYLLWQYSAQGDSLARSGFDQVGAHVRCYGAAQDSAGVSVAHDA